MPRIVPYSLFLIIGFLIAYVSLINNMTDQLDTLTFESANLAVMSYRRGCSESNKIKNNECFNKSQIYKEELKDTFEDVEIISINGNEKGQEIIQNKKKLKNLKNFDEIMKKTKNDIFI